MCRRFRSILLSAALLSIFLGGASDARADIDSMDRIGRIRAALIYYIVKFIELKTLDESPITICVVGNDPLRDYLKETVAGKLAQGRSLEIVEKDETQLSHSHWLSCTLGFFGEDVVSKAIDLIRSESSRGMLAICAVKEPRWDTCLVQIYEGNNKSRIAIDLENYSASQFQISSELLDVSVVNRDLVHEQLKTPNSIHR